MKILFFVAKRYSISIISPIIKYLDSNRRDVKYAIYCTPVTNDLCTQLWPQTVVLRSVKSAVSFNADFILCPGNYVDHRLKGIKVQLFHGVGVEKPAHYVIRGFFDLYCTSGPYVSNRFHQLQLRYPHFSIQETGWVKFDHILNYPLQEKSNEPVSKKKIKILYAPTFSRRLDSTSDVLVPLIKFASGRYELYIKLHELSRFHLRSEIQNEHVGIHFIQEDDITSYLHKCDFMISDTSSVVYEFLALKKPVITYKSISTLEGTFNIQSIDELERAIEQVITDSQKWISQGQEALMQVNPYLDGKSSERVIQTIEAIFSGEKVIALDPKPANLFRKMKMLYWYYFKHKYIE